MTNRLIIDQEEAEFTFGQAVRAAGLDKEPPEKDEEKKRKLKVIAHAREILAK